MFYAIIGLLGVFMGVIGLDKLRNLAEDIELGGPISLLPVVMPWVGVAIMLYSWRAKGESAEKIASLGAIISLISLLYVMQTYYGED